MATDQDTGGRGCMILLWWLLLAIAAAAAILFIPGCHFGDQKFDPDECYHYPRIGPNHHRGCR